MMASTSAGGQSPLTLKEATSTYHPYPPPLAEYDEVVSNRSLFMSTLEKLHSVMGTKFMIPIIGGRELDLHRLFIEVTSRGGIEKIIRERRWKDVTAIFNFPSTATNASFVLRKYYISLLHHYEQIYFFKERVWTPFSTGSLQSPPVPAVPLPPMEGVHVGQEGTAGMSAGSSVIGVIDGKFDSGYLVTVTIGTEKLKGVLYQAPQASAEQRPQHSGSFPQSNSYTAGGSGLQRRRRRRRKSEIKRRDPEHPKPNRSGYNFFFAEQHARLKPLHPGKDREISRMIGELWNGLNETERAVYQNKALKDKERYKMEMESYRERIKSGQVISDATPLQQRLPGLDLDKTDDMEGVNSPGTPEDDSGSEESDAEDDDREDDLDPEEDYHGSDGADFPESIPDDVATKAVDVNKEAVRGSTWCVARIDAGQQTLQKAIDYACGAGGADCSPLQPTGLCYLPNTLQAHASYAFNSYYQRRSMAPGSCDFAATATASDPSMLRILRLSFVFKHRRRNCQHHTHLPDYDLHDPTTTIPSIIPPPPAVFTPPIYDSGIPSSGARRPHGAYSFLATILIIRHLLREIV
ncbi:hypothetical protein MLD38_036291 [Melastoma candidum]|uniref:Uncharacterized protein n=1 Tax=Melastoma candidum TaxID=119954 RepID=A0ACB9LL41_9MYRT|nr:hypothetical protein MLD38_036291 [Melastoma candidum]